MLRSSGIHPPEVGLMKIKEKRANMRQEQHHLSLLRRISLFFILPPSKMIVAPVVINLYIFQKDCVNQYIWFHLCGLLAGCAISGQQLLSFSKGMLRWLGFHAHQTFHKTLYFWTSSSF